MTALGGLVNVVGPWIQPYLKLSWNVHLNAPLRCPTMSSFSQDLLTLHHLAQATKRFYLKHYLPRSRITASTASVRSL